MKRFRSILVGIDLNLEGDRISDGSRRAALQAQWLAERTGASLTFLHSSWSDLYEDNNVIRQGPGPAGQAAIDELVAEYGQSGTPVEFVSETDRAWLVMIRRVQRGENDLVIVGRRNTAGAALGSVSRKLMRKCPCPVWVVKPDTALLHDCVMAATDLTAVGDAAVGLGASVAASYGCEFHIVHAWQKTLEMQFDADRLSPEETEAESARIQQAAEKHILEVCRSLDFEIEPKLHIGCNAPVHAIQAGVEQLGVDLLVMGTVSRGGIAGFLMGNTAESILDRVDCSLLTIKPADFISPVTAE